MLVAITRPTGEELTDCELTHIDRTPIDVERAVAQHDAYVEVLRSLDVVVVELPRLVDHPDAVFVEDTALVLPEVAVLLRPGAESRRGEVPTVAEVLADYRRCIHLDAPATLDGGDVIVFGKQILVGQTTRSNGVGIRALGELVAPFGYSVEGVVVQDVLHLKSAATVVDDETLIAFRGSVDLGFVNAEILEAHPDEPQGANVVRLGEALLADASAPRTITLLRERGETVVEVHVDEFGKAEGAISCQGLIFEQ
ncbi:MAG: dimethylargininase [Acidimicrobiia bacterium]|nr:dimethylargininase [Acidimicrobiia bacterium]